jgi:hypothetical protein
LVGAGLLAVAGGSAYVLTSPRTTPYIGARAAALSLRTERTSLARAMQATSLAEQDQRFTWTYRIINLVTKFNHLVHDDVRPFE